MTLLLLAGTQEAREIGEALEGHDVIASFAGVTQTRATLPVATRVGGFGGEAGFETFLKEAGITAVLDATHPFATQMSLRSHRIAGGLSLPYGRVLRPAWQAGLGDTWHSTQTVQDICAVIPKGCTVFLAVGGQHINQFAPLAEGRQVVLRQIDTPERDVLPATKVVVGRPPFPVEEEVALLRDHSVDWLVTKNSGGAGGVAKLLAARQLGVPVAMIERPCHPVEVTLETVDKALEWISNLPK